MNTPRHLICGSVLTACLALVTGCATTSAHNTGAKKDCTRFTAAARVYGEAYSPMRFQKHSIEACKHGDLNNCVAAPIAIPVMALLAVGSVPFVFPILMASDTIHRNCGLPTPPDTTSAGASGSDSQPGGTELPAEVVATGWVK